MFGFSDRAGFAQSVYLVAPSGVVSTAAGGGLTGTIFGTSFSAPHVAGAAALLFQLFPNLTGREVGEILLMSAFDLGATGIDAIFGHGLLDIGAAIQPMGTQSVATQNALGITRLTALDISGLQTSIAFGDAFSNMTPLSQVMMLDGFRRSYFIDYRRGLASAASATSGLLSALEYRQGLVAMSFHPSESLVFSIAAFDPHQRVQAFVGALPMLVRMTRRISAPDAAFSFTLNEATSIRFARGRSPARADSELNFLSHTVGSNLISGVGGTSTSLAVKRRLRGGRALDLGMISGQVRPVQGLPGSAALQDGSAVRVWAAISQRVGRAKLRFTGGAVSEKNMLLGALSQGALALGQGAGTIFAQIDGSVDLGRGVTLSGRYLHGAAFIAGAEGSLFSGTSRLRLSEFSALLTKRGVLGRRDLIGLAISQPLRIEAGHTVLNVATTRDYVTDTLGFSRTVLGLTPSGRELDFQLAYRWVGSWAGKQDFSVDASLLYQIAPGHTADARSATSILVMGRKAF